MADRKAYSFKTGRAVPCQIVFPTPKTGRKQNGGQWYMWKFDINQIEERCFLPREASETLEDMDLQKGDWVSIENLGDDGYQIDFCDEPEWPGEEPEEDMEERKDTRRGKGSRARKQGREEPSGRSGPAQTPQRPTVADALAGMGYIVDRLLSKYAGVGTASNPNPNILSGEDIRSLAQTVYKSVEREMVGFATLTAEEPEEEPEEEPRRTKRRTSRREPPPEPDDDDLPF